ncbi:MAG TPA: T9SS type A sorting domain-containing protein [Ignavibacteria bacterium]|nr:T9SS type A sorting domain-containing protein [Ignavibacteria bacterium]
MKTIFKFSLAAFLIILISAFTFTNGVSQCNPTPPKIQMLDFPGGPPGMQARYTYVYPPYVSYAVNGCFINNLNLVDPCNPWVLEFYVAYYESGTDRVSVKKPVINWDTVQCQDFRSDYVYPLGYVPNTYADSVVVKYTMIPKPADNCIPDGNAYACWRPYPLPQDSIYNLNCWVTCLNERITFECEDECQPFPNFALCITQYQKPLPVEMSSFVSSVNNRNVTLNWSTSSELNNSGFEIERKTDGSWSKVGFVQGLNAAASYTFTDNNLSSGSYGYRLKQLDFNGNFAYHELENNVFVGVPENFSLSQNYPNPFNPETKIDFAIPYSGNVTMKIYDMNGREVATLVNEFRAAGYYTENFNASNLSSGVYYYKLITGINTAVNKMVVIK